VLDNAGYHHACGDHYMKLGGTKEQLIQKLTTLGVMSITVSRNGKDVVLRRSTWSGRGGSSSPSVKELNDALKVELPKHKEFQTTEIQRMFNEQQWQLIFTPPYTPETQPIEMVWAYVKQIVASVCVLKHTSITLHVDIIMAFYGDVTLGRTGVTPELCQSLIDHSYKWCNQFISEHVYPGGNLSSLALWIHQHPEQEAIADYYQDVIDGCIQEEQNEQHDIFDFIGDDG
jgi:hypothetical protein